MCRMNRNLKRRIKKYLLTVAVLLVSVTIFANNSFFARPVGVFAENFAAVSAALILPKGRYQQTTLKESADNTKSTEKEEETEETATGESISSAENTESSQSNTSDENKTLTVSGEEKGGRVLSQTIDKSGATASYGDVYVNNKTQKTISIKEALSNKPNLKIKLNSSNPLVLIVHTHATESFFEKLVDYYPKSWGERDNNTENNMVAVGKVIAKKLNNAGIKTVQSETLHDKQSYTGSYDRSRETIKEYLKKYPSIKVVIDVHRDAINEEDGDKIRPIVNIKNKTAGQIMIISGCQSGPITGYPNWQKNLRFSIGLQQKLERTYPNLARPLFFAEKKYNQDLCENSFLLEVGSQANLLSEAKYSAELFSDVFIKYLKEFSR